MFTTKLNLLRALETGKLTYWYDRVDQGYPRIVNIESVKRLGTTGQHFEVTYFESNDQYFENVTTID